MTERIENFDTESYMDEVDTAFEVQEIIAGADGLVKDEAKRFFVTNILGAAPRLDEKFPPQDPQSFVFGVRPDGAGDYRALYLYTPEGMILTHHEEIIEELATRLRVNGIIPLRSGKLVFSDRFNAIDEVSAQDLLAGGREGLSAMLSFHFPNHSLSLSE